MKDPASPLAVVVPPRAPPAKDACHAGGPGLPGERARGHKKLRGGPGAGLLLARGADRTARLEAVAPRGSLLRPRLTRCKC